MQSPARIGAAEQLVKMNEGKGRDSPNESVIEVFVGIVTGGVGNMLSLIFLLSFGAIIYSQFVASTVWAFVSLGLLCLCGVVICGALWMMYHNKNELSPRRARVMESVLRYAFCLLCLLLVLTFLMQLAGMAVGHLTTGSVISTVERQLGGGVPSGMLGREAALSNDDAGISV